jgi:histidyl-tRNA synthetase
LNQHRKSYRAPRGIRDVLPEEVPTWRHLEQVASGLAGLRGYREIRPALLEETELFTRSVGEVTDIVEKEMFTVLRGDHSFTLRPEATAGIARAYLEAGLHKSAPVQRLFHVGPMFRYERPQKGRERMFTQFDVEALGSLDPRLDAEVIELAVAFFRELGVTGIVVHLNSMGDGEDRDRFREAVRASLAPHAAELCATCRDRLERSVLRVLDCKNPRCREVLTQSGTDRLQMMEVLSDANRAHIDEVRARLDDLGLDVVIDGQLVRGFDYYTRTVFEIHWPELGARSALCGGGRYDHLLRDLGGPDLGAVGFAIGFTGTLIALREKGLLADLPATASDVFVVAAADEAPLRAAVFQCASELRSGGVSAVYDTEGKSLKAQMKAAGRGGQRFAVLIGADELARGVVQLKDLGSSEQAEVARDGLLAAVRERLAGS